MKKKLFIIILVFIFNPAYPLEEQSDTLNNIVVSSPCLDKNILSNVLNLSGKQIELNKEFLEKDDCPGLYLQLEKEKAMLKCMDGCPVLEIAKQKLKIKKLEKNLKSQIKNEGKNFKKTLTRSQRSKYSMINKLQREEVNKHEYDYYKNNPQMPYFGNP